MALNRGLNVDKYVQDCLQHQQCYTYPKTNLQVILSVFTIQQKTHQFPNYTKREFLFQCY